MGEFGGILRSYFLSIPAPLISQAMMMQTDGYPTELPSASMADLKPRLPWVKQNPLEFYRWTFIQPLPLICR